MALIKCPDCNKDISSRAHMCPFCGCPSEYFFDNNSSSVSKDDRNTNINTDINDYQNNIRSKAVDTSENYKNYQEPDSDKANNSNSGNEGMSISPAVAENPDDGKFKFQIIQDPERESDKFKNGKTHVLFRLSNSRSISIAKTDLFYAPIRAEARLAVKSCTDEFAKYISATTSINELTKAACDVADKELALIVSYFVEKLISYNIYNYDVNNFVDRCGAGVFLENTGAYKNVKSQISDISDYADELAYQRVVERASRSHWEGGGFGIKGAIKGAIKAGAMNVATEAFRGVGDRRTDANDRNDIKSMMAAVVNDSNKKALFFGFCSCLDKTEMEYYKILGENTGWDSSRLFGYKIGEIQAKLRNIESIKNQNTRCELLLSLLTDNSLMDGVIEYALTHYYEYDFDIHDLNHFVKRLNPVALDNWKENNYKTVIEEMIRNKVGEDRVRSIEDYGLTFEMIDDEYNIIDDNCGPFLLMCLIDAQMSVGGFELNDIKGYFGRKGYSGCESYLNALSKTGEKYNAIKVADTGNEISLTNNTESYSLFVNLREDLNKQLKSICNIRGIECSTLNEAKNLFKEWATFESIYSAYDTYADYDSGEMQKVIEEMETQNFKDNHIKNLIYGDMGLVEHRKYLLSHETTEEYRRGNQIKLLMKNCSDGKLFVYGEQGFLKKAKEIRFIEKVMDLEPEIFPLVIYDVSDGDVFKGFIISEKYLYNFNPLLGIGLGYKAILLSDIVSTSSAGKNRIFRLSNGKSEKVKILGAEDMIISVLSKVYKWGSGAEEQQKPAFSRAPQNTINTDIKKPAVDESNKKSCPVCGQFIDKDSKYCGFCGSSIVEQKASEINESIECPSCRKRIATDVKFCNFCGSDVRVNNLNNNRRGIYYQKPASWSSGPVKATKKERKRDKKYDKYLL